MLNQGLFSAPMYCTVLPRPREKPTSSLIAEISKFLLLDRRGVGIDFPLTVSKGGYNSELVGANIITAGSKHFINFIVVSTVSCQRFMLGNPHQ